MDEDHVKNLEDELSQHLLPQEKSSIRYNEHRLNNNHCNEWGWNLKIGGKSTPCLYPIYRE